MFYHYCLFSVTGDVSFENYICSLAEIVKFIHLFFFKLTFFLNLKHGLFSHLCFIKFCLPQRNKNLSCFIFLNVISLPPLPPTCWISILFALATKWVKKNFSLELMTEANFISLQKTGTFEDRLLCSLLKKAEVSPLLKPLIRLIFLNFWNDDYFR